jgi:putative transposase
VGLIKALFANPALALWPGTSLYYEGLRNRGLHIALSTFYKYTTLLGLKRKWPRPAAKRQGIRAAGPNEFLHVDTTYWKLGEGLEAAIVFVSDNFSRAILGWRVALGKHAANVVEALRDTVATIRRYHPGQACAVLVADGGGENHALCVDELLQATDHPAITKIIARKDIRFSNSPIEAINKIFKRYLRHYQPRTLKPLEQVTALFAHDYGSLRPHGSLKGLIPMEAYTRPGLAMDFRQRIREARASRIEENRKVNCAICPAAKG